MNNYPANHVYNPAFRYVRSEHTNIRETFERIKREQERTVDMVHYLALSLDSTN